MPYTVGSADLSDFLSAPNRTTLPNYKVYRILQTVYLCAFLFKLAFKTTDFST
jgi:hypothetical protein